MTTPPTTHPITITLLRDKDCKHSVVYRIAVTSLHEPRPVETIYVNRSYLGLNPPDRLTLSIHPEYPTEQEASK